MWVNATESDCIKFNPENNGWLLLDGFLKPTWFLGDSTPTQVKSVLCASLNKSSDNENSDISSDESDSCDDSVAESSDDSDF